MAVLVRIFLKEGEEFGDKPVYREVVEQLRRKGLGGATVLKAILGYGTTGEFHYEGIEAMSYDLPVVIEFVEQEDKALKVMEDLKHLLRGKLISMEEVKVWE
ncbi:hypothetical protein BCF55_0279 [Hydrogenivirga caldilitoris]|uniref:Uncharacterized protein n=1 Tax=Hydrogenivirga caldilitoris TaxID=246264 RepID=A0A497XMA0_9AQUI|nr:DUF190 domain-containing protein [Hydrogenivirga caldilitoris]RLJ70017.1 hypothetical protein BCF55_0279 [Hydrogenivirga caldilitoris]